MNDPLVDIVVLNHNGKAFLDACFQSLSATAYPNIKLYLLDNGSTENDIDYVRARYPNTRIISNPANNGYCAAYNLAFSVCKGKYIVCLNNDVTVKPDWLDHLVRLAESDPQIGALQPRIVSYSDESRFEYAGASGGMMDVFGYPFLRGRLFSTIEDDRGQYNDVADVFWTSGAAMFLRRSALDRAGLLDETIVHHMDEIDLCWRLRMHRFKLKVQPLSVIRHIGGATIRNQSFKKTYWNHRNSIYIMLKNYGPYHAFTKVPVHILLDYVAVVQSLLTAKLTVARGILAAHLWLILNAPLIIRKRLEVQQNREVSDRKILPYLYKGSIVLEYFLLRRKTYQSLKYHTHEDPLKRRSP